MGLTGAYNSPVSDEDGISIIKYAFSKGITFFDTSDVYGPHTNEILLGKVTHHQFLLLLAQEVEFFIFLFLYFCRGKYKGCH
jgi:diketogulonate reductase-like aldo/keto reductase